MVRFNKKESGGERKELLASTNQMNDDHKENENGEKGLWKSSFELLIN